MEAGRHRVQWRVAVAWRWGHRVTVDRSASGPAEVQPISYIQSRRSGRSWTFT